MIRSIEDLSTEEQQNVLSSIMDKPCLPFSLRILKQYAEAINLDFSQVKEEDMDRKTLITPEQVSRIVMRDYPSLRAMSLLISNKIIYAKAHEAFVVDHEHMDMSLDEFRARCETEYDESQSVKDHPLNISEEEEAAQ